MASVSTGADAHAAGDSGDSGAVTGAGVPSAAGPVPGGSVAQQRRADVAPVTPQKLQTAFDHTPHHIRSREFAKPDDLPSYLKAQPAIARRACLACIKDLAAPTNVKKKGNKRKKAAVKGKGKAPARDDDDELSDSARPDDDEPVAELDPAVPDACGNEICSLEEGACKRCSPSHKKCIPVAPRFRRAANVLLYTMEACSRNPAPHKLAALRKYGAKFNVAYEAWDRSEMKLEKAVGPKIFSRILDHRFQELQMNWDRFGKGYGGMGECEPSNAIVDHEYEQRCVAAMNDREKRLYWVGEGHK